MGNTVAEDAELEDDFWCLRIRLVASHLFEDPNVVVTALTFFRLALKKKTLHHHQRKSVATAALFLAARACECPCRLAQLITLGEYLLCRELGSKPPAAPDEAELIPPTLKSIDAYFCLRRDVIEAEVAVLNSMGFVADPVHTADILAEHIAAINARIQESSEMKTSLAHTMSLLSPPSCAFTLCPYRKSNQEFLNDNGEVDNNDLFDRILRLCVGRLSDTLTSREFSASLEKSATPTTSAQETTPALFHNIAGLPTGGSHILNGKEAAMSGELDLATVVINRNDIIKEGWLLKQSRYLKDWRRRWVILTSTYLCSFRSPNATYQQPTEALRLADCSTVKSADEDVHKDHAFRVDTPNRCFFLAAETSSDKECWIGHIGRQMVRPSVMKEYSDEDDGEMFE